MCKSIVATLLVLTVGIAHGMQLHAMQQPGSQEMLTKNKEPKQYSAHEFRAVALKKVLSVDLENVTLEQGLNTVARKAGLKLVYSTNIIPAHKRVSLQKSEMTLENVLWALLADTGLRFGVSSNNHLVIMKWTKEDKKPVQPMQAETVSGTVTDAQTGETLPGVNILVKGTSTGASTDADGQFELEVESLQDTLVVSFVGYKTRQVPINGRTEIDVALQTQAISGEEMVVVGYGEQKQRDLTGSIASINSETISSIPSLRVDDALRGKVSGVHIVPTSAEPGAKPSIRIRGSNSISANNEPLIVVDGFIGGIDLNQINTDNIESVEVLKDASATSLYGSRGANGVILITTKKGTEGESEFSYKSNFSYQSPLRLIDVMNATEYAKWRNDIAGTDQYPNPESLGEGTNWQDEVYRNAAPMMNHTLSMSGGNKSTQFYVSGNYLDQDGLFKGSNYTRYQLRINLQHEVNDWLEIGNNVSFAKSNEIPKSLSILNIAGFPPTLPVFNDEGNYTVQTFTTEFANDNPVANSQLPDHNITTSNLLGNVFAEVSPVEDLSYKLSVGTNYDFMRNQNYLPSSLYRQKGLNGTASKSYNEVLDLLIENTVKYALDFGVHSLDLLGGYTRQTISNNGTTVSTSDFPTDAFSYNNLGSASERTESGSEAADKGFESFLFRLHYDFTGKYLLTLSTRADGASVFPSKNKWGYFPSAAIAWRISDENFLNESKFIDDLKLRISYGVVGNPGLQFGASKTRLSPEGNKYILGSNQRRVAGIAANSLGNSDLKWESTNQLDIGINLSLLNNRVNATLDLYKKKTNDLLLDKELPWLSGFTSTLVNAGSVKNQGIEFSLRTINIEKQDFSWETSFNITHNRNKVLNIVSGDFLYQNQIGNASVQTYSGILKEGEPMNTFYGFERDGIWNTQEEIERSGLSGFSVFPGGKRYKDLNGDGEITKGDDRTIIGNANPDIYGGIGNTFHYKSFDLSFFWSFSVGNKIFNETKSLFGVAFNHNSYKKYTDRWTPKNTDTNIPSVKGLSRSFQSSETGMLEDGSFLKLRNINLGYNLKLNNVIKSVRFFITGKNILSIDQYSGYDPEVSRSTSNYGSSNLRRGYDNSQYPSLRAVGFGLNIKF